MTYKFSSKEIHFLKTDSENSRFKAPDTYFSDLILTQTPPFKAFVKRLLKAKISGKKFLCAVLQADPDKTDTGYPKTKDIFETTFNSLLNHKRGIWECLDDTSFVMAFWDYADEKKASFMILSLKDKISTALNTSILTGMAVFPFHEFSKVQTFHNALKAADHAAFFGPDTLIHFDATSLNISADRLYQLNKCNMAIAEYQKGLEIDAHNLNLVNSLGVCFGVMGKLDNASLEFKKAMKINPGEPMVIYNMALLHHIKGNIDKAILYLRKAHGIKPLIFEVELLLAQLLIKQGKSEQAISHLDTASRIHPASGLTFRIKGELFLSDNLPEKANHEFNRAIKLNPSDAASLSGYANSLERQEKNLNIALSFAKNSVALAPDNQLFKKRLKNIQEKIEKQIHMNDQIKTA